MIVDFDVARDQLNFASDTGIRLSRTFDANGDGALDLWLGLTDGGSVTLLGVNSLTDLGSTASRGAAAHPSANWTVLFADPFASL